MIKIISPSHYTHKSTFQARVKWRRYQPCFAGKMSLTCDPCTYVTLVMLLIDRFCTILTELMMRDAQHMVRKCTLLKAQLWVFT